MHTRNLARLFGFARATVPDTIFHVGPYDRFEEERRWCSRQVFRRLVAKTLAKQFMKEVEQTCSPFQFALSTRAGVDCVGHAVRVATDADHTATVLSVHGIGAFDHVFRASMLQTPRGAQIAQVVAVRAKVVQCPVVLQMGRFRRKQIWQHEGANRATHSCHSLLFSLAIHNALEEVRGQMQEEELLFAFLDDIYIVSSPARTRAICSRLICTGWLEYNCTKAKQGSGTELECVLRMWKILVTRSGVPEA